MNKRALILGFMLVSGSLYSGCSTTDCVQLKKDYDAAIEGESLFVKDAGASDDLPVHLGIAVRDDLLNEVVDRAMRTGLENALSLSDKVSLASGQKIGLTTTGKVADLGLFPDKACVQCLRVDGRLDGSLGVKLPILGNQHVPLTGSFSVVAPVEFGRTDDGRAAVRLDLAKAAELGRSTVNPEVSQLPPTWWKVIQSPLGKLMLDAITKDLPSVTLFTFDGLDLGIDGLEVLPARIVSDPKHGVVFAGFSTNLALPEGVALEPRTNLGKNDDLAIGLDRRLLGALSTALMKSGKLSRTWTKDGKESPTGPIAVTQPTVALGDVVDGKQPYEMTFRAWNVPPEGKCWWADTRASGVVEMAGKGKMRIAIDDVKIVESSLPGVFKMVANWSTSKLIGGSSKVLTKSLAPETVEFPGGAIELDKARLLLEGNGAWLSGNVAVGDKPEK